MRGKALCVQHSTASLLSNLGAKLSADVRARPMATYLMVFGAWLGATAVSVLAAWPVFGSAWGDVAKAVIFGCGALWGAFATAVSLAGEESVTHRNAGVRLYVRLANGVKHGKALGSTALRVTGLFLFLLCFELGQLAGPPLDLNRWVLGGLLTFAVAGTFVLLMERARRIIRDEGLFDLDSMRFL